MEKDECSMEKGLGWRVGLSIIVGIGWLVFIIIWLFFYWGSYSWEKNLAIILLSFLICGGVLALPWVPYGIKQSSKEKMWSIKGMKIRVIGSTIVAGGILIGLITWFWFYATSYAWYQNLAILLIAVLIGGGIMAASWAPWGMKHQRELEELDEDD